jgi:hypothetical protein
MMRSSPLLAALALALLPMGSCAASQRPAEADKTPPIGTRPAPAAVTATERVQASPSSPDTSARSRDTALGKAAATARPEAHAVPADPARVAPPPQSNAPVTAASKDSVKARKFKVGVRPFSKEEARRLLTRFKMKAGKLDSNGVNYSYRDERGAFLAYEPGFSEYSYVNDSVPFLDRKEYLPDSLIRNFTDKHMEAVLGKSAGEYAFVNFEKTMVQPRDTSSKSGVGEAVPAYYIGRYLRKLDGRYVLGENFQVRLGVGRAGAVSYLSWREPAVRPATEPVTAPSRESVEAYLAKWYKDKGRLGRQHFPYHPDRPRIRSLKPVKVFESYVLAQEKSRENPEKDGTYLVPRVTVLAEAVLEPQRNRQGIPHPPSPVLMHFHFPCTPEAGLCWPDKGQRIESGPISGMGARPAPITAPVSKQPPAGSPKGQQGPTRTSP